MNFHYHLNQTSSYESTKRLNAHVNFRDASIILKPSFFPLVLASSKNTFVPFHPNANPESVV